MHILSGYSGRVNIKRPEFTSHAERMLVERGIERKWVLQAISKPLKSERKNDGTIHYLSPISEREGRVLRVITSREGESLRIITTFFDRREKRGR
jgi:hypothetical protein